MTVSELLGIKISETLIPLERIILLRFENIYTLHNFFILLSAIAFCYLSFLLGDLAFRLFRLGDFGSAIRRAGYRILVGYGLLGLIGLAAALAGFFTAPFLRSVAVLIVVLSLPAIRQHVGFFRGALARGRMAQWGRAAAGHRFLAGVIVLWLALNLFIVFVPITGWDALDYHLPIITDLIRERRITFSPDIPRYADLPVLAEITYAVPMVIFGNTLGPDTPSVFPPDMPLRSRIPILNGAAAPFIFQVMQYGALLLFLLLAYDFLRRRIQNGLFVFMALLLILGMFDLEREVMHGGYVDVVMFLFGLASTLCLIDAAIDRRIGRREVVISAALVGFALAMKYLALFFLAMNAVFFLIALWRMQGGFAGLARRAALYLMIATAIAGFWYGKNLLWSGNPVYPMFSDRQFESAVGTFVVPRTAENFFTFPFIVFGQRFVNADETSSRLVVFGCYLLLLVLTALAFLLRRLGLPSRLLLLFTFAYLLFSFVMTHQIRFLLPVLMVMPLALAFLADDLTAYVGERGGAGVKRNFLRLTHSAIALVAVVLILGNIHYFALRFNYATGILTRDQYIGEIGWQ